MQHKAKKSLGQNFLKSTSIIKKIVEAGEISKDDVVLEIGPGKGALTEKLLEVASKVIAIEKDKNLFDLLQEKFKNEIENEKLILLEGDILDLNTSGELFSDSPRKSSAEDFLCPSSTLLPRVRSRTFHLPLNYKIIANIPYNITGAILKKFLSDENQPSSMVLMVQHEVAQRILARDKKESILSISIKAYGEPKMITKVPSRYFSPEPAVDSAVISIKNISRKVFKENSVDENKFWEIIHAGFAHKRKILISNLKKSLKLDEKTKKSYENVLGKKRAEELTLSDWIFLAKNQ